MRPCVLLASLPASSPRTGEGAPPCPLARNTPANSSPKLCYTTSVCVTAHDKFFLNLEDIATARGDDTTDTQRAASHAFAPASLHAQATHTYLYVSQCCLFRALALATI
jgi:hypothetical protein